MPRRTNAPVSPGTIAVDIDHVRVLRFFDLPLRVQLSVERALEQYNIGSISNGRDGDDLVVQHRSGTQGASPLPEVLGRTLHSAGVTPKNTYQSGPWQPPRRYPEQLHFPALNSVALRFAALLEQQREEVASILQTYETHHTAIDEINRSIDLLRHLHLNAEYFVRRVGAVASFLPQNQPLYATVCFGFVPALMAQHVRVRPPTRTHELFRSLTGFLRLKKHLSNLQVCYSKRRTFIAESAEDTEVVIFTGQPGHGRSVRKKFSPHVLFILNGAGHNPVVVTETADLERAVTSILRLVLYNQGQDCAGPNAILVQQSVLSQFKQLLLSRLALVEQQIGPYHDCDNLVGPNSDPNHVCQLSKLLAQDRRYCIYGGEMNPITGLIHPVVFVKPLAIAPSFTEFFAPVFMVQPYTEDRKLKLYFEHSAYRPHAMYVTVFGGSRYVHNLVAKGLHTRNNILIDTDLHVEERGFLPYGGLGPAASCVYFRGSRIPGATLPQRDIYRYLVAPVVGEEQQNDLEERLNQQHNRI